MDDLISRQAAIEQVEKESQVDGAYGYMDTKSIVDLLNDLPSVQPVEDIHREKEQAYYCGYEDGAKVTRSELTSVQERKKGRWIVRDNPGTGWYRVTCSECGEDVTSTIPMIGFFPDAKPLWDYCPICGTPMTEGAEDDNPG